MERQIQMQNYMREQQMSMMMARSREMFNWFGSFYALTLLAGIAGYVNIPFKSLLWSDGLIA